MKLILHKKVWEFISLSVRAGLHWLKRIFLNYNKSVNISFLTWWRKTIFFSSFSTWHVLSTKASDNSAKQRHHFILRNIFTPPQPAQNCPFQCVLFGFVSAFFFPFRFVYIKINWHHNFSMNSLFFCSQNIHHTF